MKRNAPVLLLVASVLLVSIVALSGCGVVAQQSGSSIMVTMMTPPPSSLPAGGQRVWPPRSPMTRPARA